MKTFNCTCNNVLFFENTQCLNCNKEVGWCPNCADLTSLEPSENNGFHCGKCQIALTKCDNYQDHDVCNRCILTPESPPTEDSENLCDYCSFNDTIPDLTIEGNQKSWYELEAAKRRLLYTLERIQLPITDTEPPLSFDFKGDVVVQHRLWRKLSKRVQVYTGHANGKITINIREADDAAREKMRVDLNESHRTLVGHFHHEIGHFYWELLVKDQWLEAFVALFGDHNNPTYSDALETYYEKGAPENWRDNYISAYATMHPWEDFAETFAAYLDMITVVDTAQHLRPRPKLIDLVNDPLQEILSEYQLIGLLLNEMNRTLGLLDFLPDVFNKKVIAKMDYIHHLIHNQPYDSPQTNGTNLPPKPQTE